MTAVDAFQTALDVARLAREAGGRALIVGGWVRDRLLGRESKDVDVEVYGMSAPDLRAMLERLGTVNAVGDSFAVFKIGDLDVSLPRRESKVGRGHRAFEVTGDPAMTPADAARRRDFTINAIAWDPLEGAYEDPFGGRADLDARLLRVVDPVTFGEDSLRVLRAMQLVARFDLRVDPDTERICRETALDDLPAERIWGEVEKLLQARRPSLGLAVAERLKVVARLWPELQALVGCPQDPEWHPEGDVWVHTLLVVDEARACADDLGRGPMTALMLGAVTHDLGKPDTTVRSEDGHIRSPGHEPVGVPLAMRLLDRLNVHTVDGYEVRSQVSGLVAYHLTPMMWAKAPTPAGDGAFRRLAQKVDLDLLARLARADCLGRTRDFDCSPMEWFIQRARALGVEHRPPAPLLLGRHVLELGLTPGPQVGRLLKAVYERQLDGEITTLDDAVNLARELIARPS